MYNDHGRERGYTIETVLTALEAVFVSRIKGVRPSTVASDAYVGHRLMNSTEEFTRDFRSYKEIIRQLRIPNSEMSRLILDVCRDAAKDSGFKGPEASKLSDALAGMIAFHAEKKSALKPSGLKTNVR